MAAYTAAQAVGFLCEWLELSLAIKAANPHGITGQVYPFQRPKGSVAEDIVVNVLPFDKEAVQRGTLNVNVYVPNLEYTRQGTGEKDRSRPNMSRMGILSSEISRQLAEYWNPDGTMTFRLVQDTIFQDENDQHYINFRVDFTALNI